MRRPLFSGIAAAMSTSAVGIAINVATERQESVVAWLAVAALTLAAGAVTALVDGAWSPPSDEETAATLVFQIEVDVTRRRISVWTDDKTSTNEIISHVTQKLPSIVEVLTRADAAAPLPDAPLTLPKPLPVVLVTRGRTVAIAQRHHRISGLCEGISGLDVRVCSDDHVGRRLEALHAAHVVVLDDHCRSDADGLVLGGLALAGLRGYGGNGLRAPVIILGCDDGAGLAHTDALRHSIDRPVAFLGCAGSVPNGHTEILYPRVLSRLADLAGVQTTAAELRDALRGALDDVHASHPQLHWNRWNAHVLHPSS